MKVKISDVVVGERQRKEFDDGFLDGLAQSMATIGQIQPVVVTRDMRLVCGHNRLKAAALNGWTEVEAKFEDELSELDRQIMEFEENYRRRGLTIAEEVAAQKKLHELYQERYGKVERVRTDFGTGKPVGWSDGWSQKKTAELLGITEGWVSTNLKIAEEIEKDPELGRLKSREAMRRAIQEKEEEKFRRVIAMLEDSEPEGGESDEGDERDERDEVKKVREWSRSPRRSRVTVIEGDSTEVLKGFGDGTFNLVLTDPLWKVEFDDEIFPDGQDVEQVVRSVMGECFRVLKDGSHGFMFFAVFNIEMYRRILIEAGFIVDPMVLIWYKPGEGFCRDVGMSIRPDYEPCFHFWKSPRPRFWGGLNAVHMHSSRRGNKLHRAEKPLEMLSKLVKATTVEGERVLDPFMGGGSTLEAANRMGRPVVGVDLLGENFDKAVGRFVGVE